MIDVNQFIRRFADFLVADGWSRRINGTELFSTFCKQLRTGRIEFLLDKNSLSQVTRAPLIRIAPFLVDKEFDVIVQRILPVEPRFRLSARVAYHEITRPIPASIDGQAQLFEEIVTNVTSWAATQNVCQSIRGMAEAEIPEMGAAQLNHIAALAYVADFNKLMDYQRIFEQGFHLNFTPMITKDVIDRAVLVAMERFEP